MNESTKLLFGAALVAVGFGVATLLGPPQNNSQWQSFRGQSPLKPTAGQQATVQPHSLQLRADADKLSDTKSSPPTRPTPQWLAPVSVEQSGVQPAGVFSDYATGRAQFASVNRVASAETSTVPRDQAIEPATPFASRKNNILSTTRPVYEVAQSFASTTSPPRDRDPLQDYDDSHWLDDVVSDAGEQQHIVADGDTLAKLADIYLGDSQREWEIYHNNRDVLNSPELLPIGAVLSIPARALAGQEMDIVQAEAMPATMPATVSVPVLDMMPTSDQPPSSAPSTYANSISSFASSHQPAASAMPPEMPVSSYSGLGTSVYSSSQNSGQPDLVPVKPVAISTQAPHAHLLNPIPVD